MYWHLVLESNAFRSKLDIHAKGLVTRILPRTSQLAVVGGPNGATAQGKGTYLVQLRSTTRLHHLANR